MFEYTIITDFVLLGISIGIVIYQCIKEERKEYMRRHPSMHRFNK